MTLQDEDLSREAGGELANLKDVAGDPAAKEAAEALPTRNSTPTSTVLDFVGYVRGEQPAGCHARLTQY